MHKFKITLNLSHGVTHTLSIISDAKPEEAKQMLFAQLSRASLCPELIMLKDADSGDDITLKGSELISYVVKDLGAVKGEHE
ncbi:hypothetical protein [Bacillus paranthracis]|uniref:hypothetical protein n=1 Tax=Bacillus paranthracis TaxID=2026186 RepID=UPI003D647A92